MQATGASLMRRLSSAIHPQLPLDARQTSQLLASLTTSFQRHLDKAHPVSHSTTGNSVREGAVPLSSFTENKSHFEKIIHHPSFAGLQHSASPNANLAEKTALAALRLTEEKLKQGTLSVIQASNWFKSIYHNRVNCQPRSDLSFASRFMTLLQASGPDLVNQFFLEKGARNRWVRLMFRENREKEILSIVYAYEKATRVLPTFLAVTLQYRPLRQFKVTLDQVENLINTKHSANGGKISEQCVNALIWILLREKLDIISCRDRWVMLEAQLSLSTFATFAPGSLSLLLALADMLHRTHPRMDKFIAFLRKVKRVPDETAYWTLNHVHRELLLESSLKAARILCVQERIQDAQEILAFAEVLLDGELLTPAKPRHAPSQSWEGSRRVENRAPEEDEDVLSRLVGLLPS